MAIEIATVDEPRTKEILSMLRPYDDYNIEFGRMADYANLDYQDFDALPKREVEIDPDWDGTVPDVFHSQSISRWMKRHGRVRDSDMPGYDAEEHVGDAPPPFQSPIEEQFPVFAAALRRFQAEASPARVVRFDDEETHVGLVCESAVRELDRRLQELRELVEQHVADGHGPPATALRRWDVIGAVEAVRDLKAATTADEAQRAMPAIPLGLPDFARGKVHCWRDGDCVICSIHFHAADGSHRIATTSARPSVDADEVSGCAVQAGLDPVTVLGALDDLADAACGRRMVRDLARAALSAEAHPEVLGMDGTDPVLMVSGGDASTAPLAALMYLQQACDAGDPAARREMAIIEAATETPSGREVAVPALAEARRRLAAAREQRRATVLGASTEKPTLVQRLKRQYLLGMGCL